uniref:Uncharacterized protein n=1 Tax=Sphaerodactylus townsendi TaxID=933632 RepID=A0ACB8GAS7_9SAUR
MISSLSSLLQNRLSNELYPEFSWIQPEFSTPVSSYHSWCFSSAVNQESKCVCAEERGCSRAITPLVQQTSQFHRSNGISSHISMKIPNSHPEIRSPPPAEILSHFRLKLFWVISSKSRSPTKRSALNTH